MDYGIALAPRADSWKLVQRAEKLGFSHAWFYDTQMLSADVFVSLAAAAVETAHIRLGTGVLIPSNRIAPSAANALASLNQLAPGRILFGVGTGFTGRRTMGLGALRLAEVEEYVRIVRGLLAEETVEWEFENRRRKIRFLNPEVGAINTRDPIPVHLSAFGPKGRDLAARMADGWMTFALGDAGALADLQAVTESCRRQERDPGTLYTTVFSLGCVLADGESCDSPRARAQAGPLAAVMLHNFVEAREFGSILKLPPELEALVSEYEKVVAGYEPADARYLNLHRGHLIFLRPEEERFINGELIRNVSFTATREELTERLRTLRDAGYDQWTVQLVEGQEAALDDWAEVIAKV